MKVTSRVIGNSTLQFGDVLVFYDAASTYNPQGSVRKATPDVRKGTAKRSTNYGGRDRPYVQEFEGYPRTVLPIPSEGRTVHPTQKPVALMEYMIRTYANEGDTVLANCMAAARPARHA